MTEAYLAAMTAMVISDFGTDKDEIGTGFPIFSGMVVTARHCLFRGDSKRQSIQVEWPEFNMLVDAEIYFDCADADIAILSCDTPIVKHKNIISNNPLSFSSKWCSWGYPKASYKKKQNTSELGSASGTIQPDNASIERRISIIGNVVEDRLWMGSSGAPVFEFNEESRSYSFIGIKLKVLGNYQDSLSMLSIHEALKNKELEKAFENFHPLIDQFIIPDPYSDDKTKENIIKSIVDVFKDQDDLIVLPFLFSLNEGSSIGSDFEKTAKYLVDQDPKDAILLIVGTVRGLLSSKRNKIVDGNRSGLIFFVEKLVSYLPILSIDYTDISKLSPYLLSSSFPSLYFKMGEVRTISGVEIVLSRRFNRFPSFKGGPKKTLKAKNGININDFNLKWNESETVVRWKKIIWNKFFEYDALDLNDHNLKFDISKNGELNSRIKIDRTNKKEQMFLSVDISSVPCGEEFKKEIFNALMQDLNQLTFVEFNYEGDDCIYIDNEYDLTTIISDFYRDCY